MLIGIDLGTSTSEVAFADETGKVTVIPNNDGETIIPSVVYLKQSGRAVVGSEAAAYLFTRPTSTFMEVKRKFGTGEMLTAHDKTYSPEQIQAHIVEYLVDCAEEFTGKKVSGAVITVPAYFTDTQRKQTVRAGELAGVCVERVINEPTAAAMDYGLQNMSQCENILVYDFGGGTLDVTVLELFEGVIDVKSSCGNNHLGGKDFDETLMKFIAGKNEEALMANPKAKMRLKQAATDCKITLSGENTAQVRLPLITDEISIDRTVMRSEFEELIRERVESTAEQIDTALKDAGLEVSDIQRVILVGGTTRIPLVREFVKTKLGVSAVINDSGDFSPELMVVRGAAIQAAIIDGIIAPESSVVLADVCPFTLGIDVATEHGLIVDPLIRRNVTIPYEQSKIYEAMRKYQKRIFLSIYQGESKYPQENTRIGSLVLDKLPMRQDEHAQAEVTFSYDVNGILSVSARALGNKSTASTVIDISKSDEAARPPVKLSEWIHAQEASKYRPLLRKVQKMLDEFIGTPDFIEMKLYRISDCCNELKADIILGDSKGAELSSEILKDWLERWKDTYKDITDGWE